MKINSCYHFFSIFSPSLRTPIMARLPLHPVRISEIKYGCLIMQHPHFTIQFKKALSNKHI